MRGWQSSGSLRANRHYQSNKPRGNKYIFEKNPFSGYTSDWPLFAGSYSFVDNTAGSTSLRFNTSGASLYPFWGIYGGVRTGQLEAQTVYNKTDINGSLADVKRTGCGVIHIGAVIPDIVKDVTFKLGKISRQSGFIYQEQGQTAVDIYNYTGDNDGGSNDSVEWKTTGADLNTGIDIYVRFRDKTKTQSFITPITGYRAATMQLDISRVLTAEEINALKADNNKDFLITCNSRAISEADYESAG